MRNYWSCSEFADWVRGTKKPLSLTSKEWDEWKVTAEKKHPFRYWIAEEALDYIQKVITFPSNTHNKIVYYINNRWITKTHALTSNLKKGDYYDLDTRIIECLFDELVNFVEVELAWHHVMWSEEQIKEAPWWRRMFRFRTWRSSSHGLAQLEWESNLKYDEEWDKGTERYGKPTPQAIAAQEKLALYNWWKQRANRPDPIKISGWSEYCRGQPILFNDDESAQRPLDKLWEIEKQYEDEDTEMLIRLIKVRKSLWT